MNKNAKNDNKISATNIINQVTCKIKWKITKTFFSILVVPSHLPFKIFFLRIKKLE